MLYYSLRTFLDLQPLRDRIRLQSRANVLRPALNILAFLGRPHGRAALLNEINIFALVVKAGNGSCSPAGRARSYARFLQPRQSLNRDSSAS